MKDIFLNIVFRVLTVLGGIIVLGIIAFIIIGSVYITKEFTKHFDFLLYLKIGCGFIGIVLAGLVAIFSVALFNDWINTKISKIK